MARRGLAAIFVMAFVGFGLVAPSWAQTEAEFIEAFSGEWRVHDESFASNGELCTLTLSREQDEGRYALDNAACSAELASVARWAIVENQMVLADEDGVVVTLGGNQRRMTGATRQGNPVILERVGASGMMDALEAARRASGCYYLGFTDECVPDDALVTPEPDEDGEISLNVLVNLNVRAEARDDANVIGVVPAESCIVAHTCTTASDGAWCRAGFGDRTGWLRQLALRQNRWAVVTYTPHCEQDD